MKNLIIVIILTIYNLTIYGQRVGVNVVNPDNTLDINGTMRLRDPVKIDESNTYISADGESAATLSTYTPTKTVVTQPDGTLGFVDGVALTELPGESYIRFSKKVTSYIGSSTPDSSIVSLDLLEVRLDANNSTGNKQVQVRFTDAIPSNRVRYGYFGIKQGKGRNTFNETTTHNGPWKPSGYDARSTSERNSGYWQNLNPDPRVDFEDYFSAIIVRYTAPREVYRVSVLVNNGIPLRNLVPAVPSAVTIFVEKLE